MGPAQLAYFVQKAPVCTVIQLGKREPDQGGRGGGVGVAGEDCLVVVEALRRFAAGEGVGAVGVGGGGVGRGVGTRRIHSAEPDGFTGNGGAVRGEGAGEGEVLVECGGGVGGGDGEGGGGEGADHKSERGGRRGSVGVAGEACLVEVVALGGFGAGEGVGAVGVGGGVGRAPVA